MPPRVPRSLHRPALLVLLALGLGTGQAAAANTEILHEQIPPDPRDDLALSVSLDGDLPAAIDTPSGIVAAPDPRRPVTSTERSTDAPIEVHGRAFNVPPNFSFVPDSDTRRPDQLTYDDPFTPSTAPFKRLIAVDAVVGSFALVVHEPALVAIQTVRQAAADGSEEQFYGDMVVDLEPGKRVRIPSVGPGAKVLRARAGVGATDVGFHLFRDGADNWFIEGDRQVRARFVIETTIPRRTFGGEFGDPGWSDLPEPAPLPANVAEDANKVALAIGVSHALSPRENVKRLVDYFRAFTDSDATLAEDAQHSIYLDLSLSKKGVCRHRAYAFLVTALGLGLPVRMIMNEAHAWVEVYDASLWRRIDLGGAGRALSESLASEVPYEPPPDPFAWPPGAARGDDLVDKGRTSSTQPGGASPSRRSGTSSSGASRDDPRAADTAPGRPATSFVHDERVVPQVTVAVVDPDARRGAPVHIRGEVRADGPCGNVVVDVVLRDAKNRARERFLGTLATDADGAFSGALIVPAGVALGDYDLVVRTPGDAHCGPGRSP
jgi:hypothetical protein